MAPQEKVPRSVGSARAGEEAASRSEIWVVVRAVLLLAGGIIVLSWIIG